MLFPIDHGNSAMKTVNFVFPSGLIDNPIRPPVDTEMLEYDGKFWTLSGQRISYMRDKTKDERYWILTLFAIAKELEKSGNTSPMVEADLAVGLPPEHYALRQRFADYFKRGRVNFVYNGAPICLLIRHVFVYPQAYAAVVPQAGRLKEIPRTFIIDIGGYTTDVMLLRNAAPDLQFCRSLEMGVIPMSNDIISRVSAMYDIKIDDDHIADIIQGRPTILPQEVRDVIFTKVRSYACDILDKLRELQVDLRANPAIFIGGGSILFRSFVEESPLVAHADFVTDPKANAIGYGCWPLLSCGGWLRRITEGSSLRRDDKYRFSLSWGRDTAEKIAVGDLLEKLKNHKSDLIVQAVWEFIGNHPEVMAENSKIVIAVQSTQTDEQTLAQIQRMIDASMERLKDSMSCRSYRNSTEGKRLLLDPISRIWMTCLTISQYLTSE